MTEGRIVAGPHVRHACARHLRDLDNPPKDDQGRPYIWNVEKVQRVCRFFPVVLRLDGGSEDAKPFHLHNWQAFIEGSLFGWVDADGFRRFRVAFIETGKGSGKSPLAAGTGIYMLMADDPVERRAEVYSAAVDKEQASILFKDAVSMCKLSDPLLSKVAFSGGEGKEYNIAFLKTGSFFRPISSESQGRGKSGYRPHCVLLDEIHEHPTNAMVEFMRAGTKNRKQALVYMITNSGVDRTSVCYEYHQYGAEVAAGSRVDESFFSYICALDEGDDPFEDRSCWPKANPSLGVTISERYLQEQVDGAKGMPSKESIVRRLNFCQWVDASNPWIDGDLWRACEVEPGDWVQPEGRPCFLALDLSSTRDLTALAAVWPGDDGVLDAAVWFWTPAETLTERENKDRVPYRTWAETEHMQAVPGRFIDYEFVAKFIAGFPHEIAGVAFDPYRIGDFQQAAKRIGLETWIWDPGAPQRDGVRLLRHGQGYMGGSVKSDKEGKPEPRPTLWMPGSIKSLAEAVLKGRLRVKKNPVLTWNSASAVLETDASGNEKWEKRKSTGRIDGIVALCMAVGAAAGVPLPESSVYDKGGILFLD